LDGDLLLLLLLSSAMSLSLMLDLMDVSGSIASE
jgi:hypothetical protein